MKRLTSAQTLSANRIAVKSLLFVYLLCFINMTGWAAKDITIDATTNSLVAPLARSYQWYQNNQKIEGATSQAFKVTKSGSYTVKIEDQQGNFTSQKALIQVTAAGTIIRIVIIGDSTVCNYASSAYPQTGWGQMLPFFFNSTNVSIENKAIGGRSSKSFYLQGRWTTIYNTLQPGNYVFIQFGHNDRDFSDTTRYADTATYSKYLRAYCNQTRAKGAYPVLVTPMNMNTWATATTMREVFCEGANDYRAAMIRVATSLKVPLIDLEKKSKALFESYGQEYTTYFLFHTYPAGEYPNYPNGNTDGTHFQENGAIELTRLIVQGMRELSSDATISPLVAQLVPTYNVTISSNNSSAALISKSAAFPSGINVTLKARLKTGGVFNNWSGSYSGTANPSIFVMSASAKSITGNFNNTGTTNTAIYEAENATISQAVTETINAGYSGASYVNTNNVLGSYIEWTVTPSTAGSYTLEFRHANGTTTDRPASVSVNGTTVISSLSFPGTGAFTTWVLASKQTVTLNAAANKIRLTATTANGCSNIDYLQVSGAGTLKAAEVNDLTLSLPVSNNLVIFPNPTEGSTFRISIGIEKKSEVQLIVTNLAGQIVLKQNLGIIEAGKLDQQVDAGFLAKGAYIVKIKTNAGEKTAKLILK